MTVETVSQRQSRTTTRNLSDHQTTPAASSADRSQAFQEKISDDDDDDDGGAPASPVDEVKLKDVSSSVVYLAK